eukprot:CAMPEP_0114697300 /NCGR_PEP_ID=MMETSP0191-20121206/73634_1 /TAXON_ID=126664 /ORGANISM="Sorites sp." /LENGTH=252 /DNA_ID=CAMNT_0001996233 /DNA_START=471 /DNA_END=1226 /DNA_ORIENTATION=+
MPRLPGGGNIGDLSSDPHIRQQQLYEQQQIQAQLARDAELALRMYQEQLKQLGVDEDIDPAQIEGGETGYSPGGTGTNDTGYPGQPGGNNAPGNNIDDGDPETIEQEERQVQEAMIKSKKEEDLRRAKEEEENRKKVEEQERKERELEMQKQKDLERKKQEEIADNFDFKGYGVDNKKYYGKMFNQNNNDEQKQMIKPPTFDMPEEYNNIVHDNDSIDYNNSDINNNNYNNYGNNNSYINNNNNGVPPPPPS